MDETRNPIERLREHGAVTIGTRSAYWSLSQLADEIEEQYMKLPLDADGVPIRPGDDITWDGLEVFCVEAVSPDDANLFSYRTHERTEADNLRNCRHVKHDTVESLLKDMIMSLAAERVIYVPGHDKERIGARMRELRDEYAERIRKEVEHEQG